MLVKMWGFCISYNCCEHVKRFSYSGKEFGSFFKITVANLHSNHLGAFVPDEKSHTPSETKTLLLGMAETTSQNPGQMPGISLSQRRRNSMQSAKTKSRADCGSDHQLPIAKFRLKLKKLRKITRPFDLNQIPYDSTGEVMNQFKD